jgi:hypothetical protein
LNAINNKNNTCCKTREEHKRQEEKRRQEKRKAPRDKHSGIDDT